MIRTAGVYLIFAAVTLRALVVFAGDRQLPLVMVLLVLFGLLLVAGPWLIRQRTEHLRSLALPIAYVGLQSGLVIALLFIPATEDFFGNLFILLGMDAVLYLGRRAGFLAVGAYALITAVALASSEQGPFFGVAMAVLYGGVALLLGGYANQVQRAEAARRQNQRLVGELQTAHGQLQSYVSQTEEMAAEQARGRLARDLHDSVTQTVFSMNLAVQGACLLRAREPDRVADQLERVEALAASAMREIQALVSHLQPSHDTVDDLPGALRRLATWRPAADGLHVFLEVSGERRLPAPVSLGLYAIAQEALTNVSRHAGTGRAFVRLALEEAGGCLEICDEGPGFDPQAALDAPGHLGLATMAERAREIGWGLVVDSAPGRGTCIRVVEAES